MQIAPNNITPAVAEGVVQLADDLFNSGNIPVAGIPRLPGLVRTLDCNGEDVVFLEQLDRPFGAAWRRRDKQRRLTVFPQLANLGHPVGETAVELH